MFRPSDVAPVPIVTRAAALRTFTVRSFAKFIERSCSAIVHPALGFRKNEGCDDENKDPCSGLLSADAFDAAPSTETPRCVCQDHGLQPQSGNTEQPGACGPLVLRHHRRGSAMRRAFGRKAADRRPDAAEGLLLCIGQ